MKTSDIAGTVEPQAPVATTPLKKTVKKKVPKVPKVTRTVPVHDAEAIIAQNLKEVLAYLERHGVRGGRRRKPLRGTT